MDERVLFIHPYNHMEPDAVPVGSVGLVNQLPGRALGRFASEVSREELARAEVVLMDVHWFFPLAVLEGMLGPIRRLAPQAKIVLGGISAAFFRDELFGRFDVDYVLSGDAELGFRPLVSALLAGEEPPPLPGVSCRERPALEGPRVDAAGFDAIDWLGIDWFPSYRDAIHERHAAYRSRPGEAAPLCYPYLPVARGCRRACDFCYGSYHGRVFGRGIRLRSPAALLRDLERIAADDRLAFVSLLFADEGLMAPYAPHLDGRGFPLDAFLYFCGNADPDVVARVRSGFSGTVNFSVIQAPDLAGLPSDPPHEVQRESFRAMLRRFEALDRTGVVFYRVHAPPEPELEDRTDPRASIRIDSGEDWAVLRPDETRAPDAAARRLQLDEIIGAGRHATTLHLARALVPALRDVLDPAHYRDVDGPQRREGGDEVATRLREAYASGLRRHRVYGFEAIELRFHEVALAARDPVWAPPGRALDGRCDVVPGLRGPGWAGRVRVGEGEARAIVACPTLRAWEAPPIELSSWPRTLLPAVPIAAGPARELDVGGVIDGRDFLLWVEDFGVRIEHRLPHGYGLPETEATVRETFVAGTEITRDCARAMWPSPRWPARIASELSRLGAAATGGALRIHRFREEPTHLDVELLGHAGHRLAAVVFPRTPGDRYLGGKRLAFAYRGSAEATFHSAFAAALRRVEATLPDDA